MRRPRLSAALPAALAAAIALTPVVLPAPAALAGTTVTSARVAGSGIPWHRYRTAPFTDAPGAVCPFGVRGVPVRDGEQYRTLESYADGSPELQEYRGPLYVRYTNQSTGRSVVRNLSGYGYFRFGRDGSIAALFLSHGGVSVPVGMGNIPAGEWVFHGHFTVQVSAAGRKDITLYGAKGENLCHTLAKA